MSNDRSSLGSVSPTCWQGWMKGMIDPPCRYKAGKSWYKHKNKRLWICQCCYKKDTICFQCLIIVPDVNRRSQNSTKCL